MIKTTFTGDEFIKALSEGSLQKPLILTGMVKKSDEPTILLFTPGIFCQSWVPIKASFIDEVKSLGNVGCGDHSHEYVSIHLKDVDQVESTLLASLLKVYIEAYEISGQGKSITQATASVYPTNASVRDNFTSVHPFSQTVRNCYYGLTADYDCDIDGFAGVKNGWWRGYVCRNTNACKDNGLGLITNP
jgi:hypothetical protein